MILLFRKSRRRLVAVRPRWRFAVGSAIALFLVLLLAWKESGRRTLGAEAAKNPAPKKNAANPPQEIPLDQRPYRVRVTVAFARSTALLPAFRQEILQSLQASVERGFGGMFEAEFVAADWFPPSRDALERLDSADLLQRFPQAKRVAEVGFDKVYLLTVEQDGPKFRVAGREWDARSQQLGPTEVAEFYQRRAIADKAYSLLPRLFHPVLEVQEVSEKSLELLLQAGRFPAHDPTLDQVREGDVITPYFRYGNREGDVTRVQFLPWTYVLADDVNQQFIAGPVISPYYVNPLGSGRRRRVDILAMHVRPRLPSSRVKLVYQTDQTKPMIGYNISLVAKRFPRDTAKKPPVQQFSGRDGSVDIAVDDDQPVIWIYVYSGKALLARVPYVPGVTTGDVLPLPDDSIRLRVEGELDLLKSRLIDIVARRATLMALAKKAGEDEDLSATEKKREFETRFEQLEALPGVDEFQAKLAVIREPSLQTARRLENRFAERRIRRMCSDVSKLIDRYLDMAPVRKFRNELRTELE